MIGFNGFPRNKEGATAIEYAMIAAFVVMSIVIVLGLLGGSLEGRFQAVMDAFGE